MSDNHTLHLRRSTRLTGLMLGLLMLGACDNSGTPAEPVVQAASPAMNSAAAGNEDSCQPEAGLSFICGLNNGEDILRLDDSNWLLVSGMAGNPPDDHIKGKIYLVNSATRSWLEFFPGSLPNFAHDTDMYPDCPGPISREGFSSHGLALQNHPPGSSQYRLYMTSHGEREAIETFIVDTAGEPDITWTGCVPLPETVWANSVVILPDGGFMATKFMDPTGNGFAAINAGEISGHVLEWHPGEALRVIEGTELSGPNGIVISDDQRYLYVAEFGSNSIMRYDLQTQPPVRTRIEIAVRPDNIHWTEQGMLLTAGTNAENACLDSEGQPCGAGWSIVEIDPGTLESRRIAGSTGGNAMPFISTALVVDGEVWTGTPIGDRLAILPLP